ncbi:hypothetical protein ACFQ61_02210 [Streptomyces sp. NPDC056500]|uniref:hypothetical protein n=1 Tax=Streptomyces sp. NPDC056500 TaxID=3345840 RepID=UPI003677A770
MRDGRGALDYGHPSYALVIPQPGEQWRAAVTTVGHAYLVVGLDPLGPGMGPELIDRYLGRVVTGGRALMAIADVQG